MGSFPFHLFAICYACMRERERERERERVCVETVSLWRYSVFMEVGVTTNTHFTAGIINVRGGSGSVPIRVWVMI